MSLKLAVFNAGSQSAACEAKIFLDDELQKAITIPGIPSGTSDNQEVSFRTDKHNQNVLKVKVDTNDVNVESNEQNNVTDRPLQLP